MTAELRDTRVLGALRFTDAVTALPVDAPLVVTAPGVRWIRNRRAAWIIASAPGLEAHELSFDAPPGTPDLGDVRIALTVEDPSGRWLSRTASIALPRDADAEHGDQPASLFAIADVPLFPTPAAPTQRGWSIVRASVLGDAPGTKLAGALVRVVRESDGVRIGAGMSDHRGEALIAVEGIPTSSFSDDEGPVVATEIAVRLEVVWDPAVTGLPDPDDLEARRATLLVRQTTARLASGRILILTL
jgi:hypothetical protein